MAASQQPHLNPRTTKGSQVIETKNGCWQLRIPCGPVGVYRWAQLDDYLEIRRSNFFWAPPLILSLDARVSDQDLPGTWGFGFWNDPFNASLGLGGSARRFPAIPNTAWFFYASPPNYLSFQDNHPAQGFMAATFSAARVPPLLPLAAAPFLPFVFWPKTAPLIRRMAGKIINGSSALLQFPQNTWHHYTVEWRLDLVRFIVDDQLHFETPISPRPPLGMVIWIDNQFASYTPDGRLRFGTLANEHPAWLEIKDLHIER
jgi:hypothetical protein